MLKDHKLHVIYYHFTWSSVEWIDAIPHSYIAALDKWSKHSPALFPSSPYTHHLPTLCRLGACETSHSCLDMCLLTSYGQQGQRVIRQQQGPYTKTMTVI